LKTLQDELTNYSSEDVFYSVYNLHQIRFIEGVAQDIAVESAKQAVTIMMTQNPPQQ